MNYAEMTDFEINCAVAEAIGQKRLPGMGWEGGKMEPFTAAICGGPKMEPFTAAICGGPKRFGAFSPCNSWADAGPIIEQHGITLAYDIGGSWVADAAAYWVDGIEWQIDGVIHENPLRAAMVVFLMMQEQQNA